MLAVYKVIFIELRIIKRIVDFYKLVLAAYFIKSLKQFRTWRQLLFNSRIIRRNYSNYLAPLLLRQLENVVQIKILRVTFVQLQPSVNPSLLQSRRINIRAIRCHQIIWYFFKPVF